MQINFPEKLKPLFNIPHEKNVITIHGGRSSAKSYSTGLFILLESGSRKIKVVYAREIASAIDKSIFTLLTELIDLYSLAGFTWTDKEIKHINGSTISFLGLKGGSKDETRTRVKGMEAIDYLILEEAEALSRDMLEIIDPTIRKDGSRIIALWNPYLDPDAIREFYPIDSPRVLDIEIQYYDNPWCPLKILSMAEELKKNDYDAWSHIFDGKPVGQSERAVFSRLQVMNAMRRTEVEVTTDKETISCDVARFGSDKTQAFKRVGYRVTDMRSWSKQDTFTTAECLLNWASDKCTKIIIDDTGIGGGVTDAINKLKYKMNKPNIQTVPINFASKPKNKELYNSIISEMWWEFEKIINKVILPEDKQLHLELTSRKYSFEKTTSRRVVETKDEYKKRGFSSPDKADAMLLCFYEPNNFARKINYRIG